MEKKIKNYLDQFAANDKEFAAKYANPDKSMSECMKYIVCEMAKRISKARTIDGEGANVKCVGADDMEVYGLAVHYYDEPNIEIKMPEGIRCVGKAAASPAAPAAKSKQAASPMAKAAKAAMKGTKPAPKEEPYQMSIEDIMRAW